VRLTKLWVSLLQPSARLERLLCKPVAVSGEARKTMKLVNPTFGETIKVSGDPTEANIASS